MSIIQNTVPSGQQQSTYVFVDKGEFEAMENALERLQNPTKPAPAPVAITPLVLAIVLLFVGAVISAYYIDARHSTIGYIISVVIAQACIDIYKGANRPKWSAAFRLVALAGWYFQQSLLK